MNKISNVVLITGGAGYIGSHIVFNLLKKKSLWNVLVVDNFTNSERKIIDKLKQFDQNNILFFEEFDLVNEPDSKWIDLFERYEIIVVIHLAGLKSVEESVNSPILYLEYNLISTIRLLKFLKLFHVDKIVFSSSATVYGTPQFVPVTESDPVQSLNPYGTTKIMNETFLNMNKDHLNFVILRYFNPIGCETVIGEPFDQRQKNVVPIILRNCLQNQKPFEIFGSDWPTEDGTAMRDYIHIKDLASAHVKSIKHLLKHDVVHQIFNIGTGKPTSVLELITTFNQQLLKFGSYQIQLQFSNRRSGDVASIWADCSTAKEVLKWKPKYSLRDAIRDSLEFYHNKRN